MKRKHLFELEDQPWFPAVIRDCMTDHLSFCASRFGFIYKTFSSKFADALKKTGDSTIVELCAGGGGPSISLSQRVAQKLGRRPDVILTDLYPNVSRMEMVSAATNGRVRYLRKSVNACSVGEEPSGFRLCFNSFHHLPEEVALACIEDAVRHRRGIAVMELVDRSIFGVLQVIFATVLVWLVAPFLRPFKWSRLMMVYLLPVIPFAILFDGIVSCLRVYSPEELRGLIAKLAPNNYEWEVGTFREPFMLSRITYLIGTPPESSGLTV